MCKSWYREVLNTFAKKTPRQSVSEDGTTILDLDPYNDLGTSTLSIDLKTTNTCAIWIVEEGLYKNFHGKEILWYSRKDGETTFLGRTVCSVLKDQPKVFHRSSIFGVPCELVYNYINNQYGEPVVVYIEGYMYKEGVAYKLFYLKHIFKPGTFIIQLPPVILQLNLD